MKILVITPLNPVIAGDAFSKIYQALSPKKKDQVSILCYPFFSSVDSHLRDKDYIANLFAMLRAAEKEDMRKKLFGVKHTIVIGNSYKSQDFDLVVSLMYDEEEPFFDNYIEALKENEEDAKLLRLDELYYPKDAELNLPTIDHTIQFLKGAIKNV